MDEQRGYCSPATTRNLRIGTAPARRAAQDRGPPHLGAALRQPPAMHVGRHAAKDGWRGPDRVWPESPTMPATHERPQAATGPQPPPKARQRIATGPSTARETPTRQDLPDLIAREPFEVELSARPKLRKRAFGARERRGIKVSPRPCPSFSASLALGLQKPQRPARQPSQSVRLRHHRPAAAHAFRLGPLLLPGGQRRLLASSKSGPAPSSLVPATASRSAAQDLSGLRFAPFAKIRGGLPVGMAVATRRLGNPIKPPDQCRKRIVRQRLGGTPPAVAVPASAEAPAKGLAISPRLISQIRKGGLDAHSRQRSRILP